MGQYVLLVVSFSTENEDASIEVDIKILDKDAHNVSFMSRPEPQGLRDVKDNHLESVSNENLEEKVILNLNPRETIRMMYFLKEVKPSQMDSGYVRFPLYSIKYNSIR